MIMTELDLKIYEHALKSASGLDNEYLSQVLPEHILEDKVNSVNRLLQGGQLELLQIGDRILYRGVNRAEMDRMSELSSDERLVYKHIENSAGEGIWVRTLKQKTNLLQGVITRCLKVLEQRALIKSVKSVKHPTRKLYMLVNVSPSADVTGGPWYTDQEMDTDFIDQLAKQCYQFIFAHSFPRHNQTAVYSANHMGYPTSSQVKRFILANRITNVDLSTDNIEELLAMLVYDGKIERISPVFDMDVDASNRPTDWMYRAIRDSARHSPFTDIPCGRCPVFDRCSDTGSITPAKCDYFKKWLAF
ncbi:34-kDa subunit of RNA polymerase III (C) [Coemansia sp. RSA 1933]|nr:34-kDa subunit of RNA polymerase III (C) [Coemansia sp. RSA 1933]